MSAALDEARPFRVKPAVGGLHDTLRPFLIQPDEVAEIQNLSFHSGSLKKRLGAIPVTRSKPKGSAIQLRADDQAMGVNSGNQSWNSYVTIPMSEGLVVGLGSTAWTIEFMLYLDKYATSDQQVLSWLPGNTAAESIRVWIDDSGSGSPNSLNFTHIDSAGASVTLTDPTGPFALATEKLISIRRGGAAGTDPTTIQIYADGVLVADGTGAFSSSNTRQTYGQILLGRRLADTVDFGFFGRIGEVRIWKSARSNANLLAYIRAQVPEDDADRVAGKLLVYYPLNKDSKFELFDESGHFQHGFLAPYIPRTTKAGAAQKQAYYFDGSHSILSVRNNNGESVLTEFSRNLTLANNNQFSLELGFTLAAYPATGTTSYLLDYRNLATVELNPTGTITVSFFNGAAFSVALTTTTIFRLGQRYLLTITRTNATGRVFVNAVQEAGSPVVVGNTVDMSIRSPFWFVGALLTGANNDSATRHAAFYMDELRLWCVDISASDLASNVNRRLPEGTTGVVTSGAAAGQYLTFQNTKICKVIDGSTALTTVGGAGNNFFGIFSTGDDRYSIAVFPDNFGTLGDVQCRQISAIVSNTNLTMGATYGNADAPTAYDGKSVRFTQLVLWIDCSVDVTDDTVYPLHSRFQRYSSLDQIWAIFGPPVNLDPRGLRFLTSMLPAALSAETTLSMGIEAPARAIARFAPGWFGPEEGPLTGSHYWKRSDGSRFLLGASGRSIFWANDRWSRSRPFAADKDPIGYSLLLMQTASAPAFGMPLEKVKDRIRIPHASGKGVDFPAAANRTWEFWINPVAVNGVRNIISKISTSGFYEYEIYIQDGKLKISWHSNGGANLITLSTQGAAIRPGKWQHVAISVTQSVASANIFVNGLALSLTATGSIAGAAATNTSDLYIGDNPTHANTAGFSYFGYIDEIRVSDSIRYSGTSIAVPTAPFSDDANTLILLHLDEGQDVFITDSSSLGAPTLKAHGVLDIDPWIRLVSNLEVSSLESPSHFSTYRDAVYRTDGINFPIRIEWSGDFAEKNYGFLVTRMGIKAPISPATVKSYEAPAATTGLPIAPNSTYTFFYTYYNSLKGVESNPSPALVYLTSTPAGGSDGFRHLRIGDFIPSDDPQVDSIRVYATTAGGSVAHLVGTQTPSGGVPPNDDSALDAEVREYDLNLTGAQIAAGVELSLDRGEAPTARYFRFVKDVCYMANSKQFPTALFVSGDNIEEFPGDSIVRLDSDQGDPITALSGSYGNTNIHQKNAIFLMRFAANFEDLDPELTQADQGSIGGHAIVNIAGNDLFRGDRSVLAFSGTDSADIGQKIESSYRGRLDDLTNSPGLDNLDVESSYAVNWMRGNEIWWTCRKKGDARNDLILVRSRTTQGNPWSIYKGLEYSSMILGEDLDGQKAIYGGTYSGYMFKLETGNVDGNSKPRQLDDTASVVTGLVGGSSTTILINTSSEKLDSLVSNAYSGLFLTVLRRNVAGKITNISRRRIRSNTTTSFTLWTALGFTPATNDTWIIGAIEAYFVTGWLDLGLTEYSKKFDLFDIWFRPQSGKQFDAFFEVAHAGTDSIGDSFALPSISSFVKRVSMDKGWGDWLTIPEKNRGHFIRLKPYSVDSEVQAEWFGWGVRSSAETAGYGK